MENCSFCATMPNGTLCRMCQGHEDYKAKAREERERKIQELANELSPSQYGGFARPAPASVETKSAGSTPSRTAKDRKAWGESPAESSASKAASMPKWSSPSVARRQAQENDASCSELCKDFTTKSAQTVAGKKRHEIAESWRQEHQQTTSLVTQTTDQGSTANNRPTLTEIVRGNPNVSKMTVLELAKEIDARDAAQRDANKNKSSGDFQKSSMLRRIKAEAAGQSLEAPLDATIRQFRNLLAGIPLNYEGEAFKKHSQIPGLPDDENVAIWITGAPADVTYREFLSPMYGSKIGRVKQTWITPPTKDTRTQTAAIKIVFYTRVSATKFWNEHKSGYMIRGQICGVVRNRDQVKQEDSNSTRVLIVETDGLNAQSIITIIREKLVVDFTRVIESRDEDGKVVSVELHFASWTGQANPAVMWLREHLGDRISIEYGRDPCGTD